MAYGVLELRLDVTCGFKLRIVLVDQSAEDRSCRVSARGQASVGVVVAAGALDAE
jgi:hypothetical protein